MNKNIFVFIVVLRFVILVIPQELFFWFPKLCGEIFYFVTWGKRAKAKRKTVFEVVIFNGTIGWWLGGEFTIVIFSAKFRRSF
jgi:hypothetical protein